MEIILAFVSFLLPSLVESFREYGHPDRLLFLIKTPRVPWAEGSAASQPFVEGEEMKQN